MATNKNRKKKFRGNDISPGANLVLTAIMTVLAIGILLPLVLVICVSFSSTESISKMGYRFIPMEWSGAAYEYLFKMGDLIGKAYLNTILYAFGGTFLSLVVMSMFAYNLALKDFKPRSQLAFFAFFTTLFHGGLVPAYVLNTQYLHLNDTVWIFLLPGLVNAFYVIILRTFIQTSIPDALFDAARIDGASDWGTYWRIVLPLSKAGLATVGLFTLVIKWNDWFIGMLYIENAKLVPIMTLLQRIEKNLQYMKSNSELLNGPDAAELMRSLPGESARMAIAVVAVLPLMVSYPFFQKYFVKGMTVGSVKG